MEVDSASNVQDSNVHSSSADTQPNPVTFPDNNGATTSTAANEDVPMPQAEDHFLSVASKYLLYRGKTAQIRSNKFVFGFFEA